MAIKRRFTYNTTTKGKRAKYGNKKVVFEGFTYDSKREMQRYLVLREAESNGVIHGLERQVKFELIPAIKEEYVEHLKTKDKIKTRTLQLPITYKADFIYYKNEEMIVEDVKVSKALIPKEFELKSKLFYWKYGKKIKLVFNANDEI
ncbi:MAG: DUF1064 domain-containing protein [Agathobacter sp.]